MTAPKLPDLFRDLDSESLLTECIESIKSVHNYNFIVDFDKKKAQCALNVSASELKAALNDRDARIKQSHETRWINIECPETQDELIKLLADKYGFSNRLRLSMLSDPLKPQPQPRRPMSQSRTLGQELWHPVEAHRKRKTAREKKALPELEKQAIAKAESEASEAAGSEAGRSKHPDLNHYRLVNDVWHYMSVDWGYDYMCIGYNAIFDLQAPAAKDAWQKNQPEAKRVWNWLVLCQDGTVISIRENPFPNRNVNPVLLKLVRANLVNVFRQLSKAPSSKPESQLLAVQIRAGLQPTSTGDPRVTDDESPSLLLYYLFDDWYTSYDLIARSDTQFGKQLDRVRNAMFRSPELQHVHSLHYYGRQLSILKRIYKSYSLIIERILQGPQSLVFPREQEPINDKAANDDDDGNSERAVVPQRTSYGVSVPPAAAVRFERLKDRINLYALSEIQACLDEKESLMTLNFNLITIKESSYIERLTRITILLAKVSILFIPVTFMSSYFTVPFVEIAYTPTVYWIAFAVIFTLSFFGIVIFGQLSGTQERKPIYTSLTRAALDGWRKFWRSIRGRPSDDE